MALTKEEKEKKIEKIQDNIEQQNIIYFVNYKGLSTRDIYDLRTELKDNNSELLVVKKTLARVALEKEGIDFDPEDLEGEVAFVFGFGDIVKPAKILDKFQDSFDQIDILGALLEQEVLEESKVEEMANLPSKQQLKAKLVSTIAAPISGFVGVLEGNMRDFINVLKQKSKNKS